MNVADQVIQVIDALAMKLGVAAEYLYPLMIRQAYVDGVAGLLGYFITATLLIVTYKYTKYEFVELIKFDAYYDLITRYKYAYRKDTEVVPSAITIALVAFSFIFVCISIFNTKNIIDAFVNPEWYAITKLLKLVVK